MTGDQKRGRVSLDCAINLRSSWYASLSILLSVTSRQQPGVLLTTKLDLLRGRVLKICRKAWDANRSIGSGQLQAELGGLMSVPIHGKKVDMETSRPRIHGEMRGGYTEACD